MASTTPSTTPVLLQIVLSGASVSVANTCTIPLDVLKVRMQLQNANTDGVRIGMVICIFFRSPLFVFLVSPRCQKKKKKNSFPSTSLTVFLNAPESAPLTETHKCVAHEKNKLKKQVKTATSLFSTEGPRAFYNGLGPALARGVFYGGTRLGLYSPLRDAISSMFDGDESVESGRNRGGEASTSFGAGLAAGCLSGCAAAALTKCVRCF